MSQSVQSVQEVTTGVLGDMLWDEEVATLEISEESFLNTPACCPAAEEMDEWESFEHSLQTLGTPRELEEVAEDIQTNLWLSVAYRRQGAQKLAKECAQAAFDCWRAYWDVLEKTHGRKLRFAVVRNALNLKCKGATRELLH